MGLGFALGAVSGVIAAVFSAVALHFILSFRKRTLSYGIPVIFNKNITMKMLQFLHKDDALEGAEVVAEGGSGKVYRVSLDGNTVAAIKSVLRINPHPIDQDTPAPTEGIVPASKADDKGILAELDTLGSIRHRNLVQLWAYVYKRDSHLLIYEYMPRGSLRDAFRQMSAGELTLTWPQRHRIACGVAQGLAYLHNTHGSCIVHRGLKPRNILLTDDLESKLADFGLAAILPDKASHASTEQLAGTIGYIAPEYHQTLRYSQKTDIYSFGVVLAQMVTVREPTEAMFLENGGSIAGLSILPLRAGSGASLGGSSFQPLSFPRRHPLASGRSLDSGPGLDPPRPAPHPFAPGLPPRPGPPGLSSTARTHQCSIATLCVCRSKRQGLGA